MYTLHDGRHGVSHFNRATDQIYGCYLVSLFPIGCKFTFINWRFNSGGGVAGLTLAIALQQLGKGDIHSDIYESAKQFTEIGAGVGLLKRPWQVMKRLGLAEDLAKYTFVPENEDAPSS